MIVIIDNYDSFTYNIVQTIADICREDQSTEAIRVFRNDKVTTAELEEMSPRRILVSPGPGIPEDAGISIEVISHFGPKIPILGVCLGHQAIGAAFGGEIVRAGRLMHGKTSMIHHDGLGVFTDIPDPFQGMRYHSLVVSDGKVPETLMVTARSDQQELMGLRHRTFAVEGVQFHPESIMTPDGKQLLKNFVSRDYPSMLART